MEYQKTATGYLIRIVRDEDVFDVLPRFCAEKGVHGASFTGVGATKLLTCGHYDLTKKEFVLTTYEKFLEIVSLTGHVALISGKPAIHIHTVASDERNNTLGGHATSMVAGITMELHLVPHGVAVERKPDEFSGLSLLSLSETL